MRECLYKRKLARPKLAKIELFNGDELVINVEKDEYNISRCNMCVFDRNQNQGKQRCMRCEYSKNVIQNHHDTLQEKEKFNVSHTEEHHIDNPEAIINLVEVGKELNKQIQN